MKRDTIIDGFQSALFLCQNCIEFCMHVMRPRDLVI